MFIQYYSKLTSILQVDLTPHFVTAEIITLSDEDEIAKVSTTCYEDVAKASIFLSGDWLHQLIIQVLGDHAAT